MRFFVEIPGQPPSHGTSYRTGRRPVTRRGKPVIDPKTMQQKVIHRPVKTERAQDWQDLIVLLTRQAKPGGWRWHGRQVRVCIELYLQRRVDADNVHKLLLDAIKVAIEVDDDWFLTCDEHKEYGAGSDARLVIAIEELDEQGRDSRHPFGH